jgi:hypothetical protein
VYSHHALPAKNLRPLGGVERTENVHVRHYQIHIEGCTHEVYRVIREAQSDAYTGILGGTKVHHDFARRDHQDHLDALYALKPAFHGSYRNACFDWLTPN